MEIIFVIDMSGNASNIITMVYKRGAPNNNPNRGKDDEVCICGNLCNVFDFIHWL